jgi:hypothetical protein
MKVTSHYSDSLASNGTYNDTFFSSPEVSQPGDLADLVHDLIEMGSPSHSWSSLVRPLVVNGKPVEHVVGKAVGAMYEDYVNGIDIQRDRRKKRVDVRVLTHWMGEVACEFHLVIINGTFESCSINRLAFGVYPCDESGAGLYIRALMSSMDAFQWV